MVLRLIVGMVLIGSLTGCATAQKPTATNQMQIRMTQMERQLEDQDRDIAELKYAVEGLAKGIQKLVNSIMSQKSSKTASAHRLKASSSGSEGILRVSVTPQEVQKALKNSGYYDGAIGGKLGPDSQSAIKAFQKDHDLKNDGIIGKKTWTELKNYLQ